MDETQAACPNCGHDLVSHRTDRQSVGEQEVVLRWTICPQCSHVGLGHWFVVDPVTLGKGTQPSSQQE